LNEIALRTLSLTPLELSNYVENFNPWHDVTDGVHMFISLLYVVGNDVGNVQFIMCY